jgi:RNA polymerase sigma-70 factor (ECF subfamily)
MGPPPNLQEEGVELERSTATAPDAAFFRTLFDTECSYVLASLRRLGVAERECEDLGNDVFFRVHQRLADLDPARPARPWLFAFCVRVASDWRRASRNRVEVLDAAPEATASAPGADEELARAQEKDLVMRALSALDMDKRAVFVLHELDEIAIPEVARTLEIAEGTAYSRLRAARTEFTAAVRREQAKRRSS